MKKLTKKILTGLTAASIMSGTLLPTSAAARDFSLQLTTTIAQEGLHGGTVNIAENPGQINLAHDAANKRIDAVDNLINNFIINNDANNAHSIDIRLANPPALTHPTNATHDIPIELVIDQRVLTDTRATTINMASGDRYNLAINAVNTTGKPANTYTGDITIQITEGP